MRVFYDANALISIFAWPGFTLRVHEQLIRRRDQLITSEHVVDEVRSVLVRKRSDLDTQAVVRVEALIRAQFVVLPSTENPPSLRLRDPNDDPVLADAEASGADILMTGDRDFIDMANQITTLRVLTPRQLYEEYLSA